MELCGLQQREGFTTEAKPWSEHEQDSVWEQLSLKGGKSGFFMFLYVSSSVNLVKIPNLTKSFKHFRLPLSVPLHDWKPTSSEVTDLFRVGVQIRNTQSLKIWGWSKCWRRQEKKTVYYGFLTESNDPGGVRVAAFISWKKDGLVRIHVTVQSEWTLVFSLPPKLEFAAGI